MVTLTLAAYTKPADRALATPGGHISPAGSPSCSALPVSWPRQWQPSFWSCRHRNGWLTISTNNLYLDQSR